MKKIKILGITFHALTKPQALARLHYFLSGSNHRNRIVVTPNPECIMQTRRNRHFRNAIRQADLRLADGIGILMAAAWQRNPIPNRVTGMDITHALLKTLPRKTTIYLLGAKPGIAQTAAVKMQAQYPNAKIIGHHHGYFNPEEEQSILAEIKHLRPEILIICTGMPRAEIWATQNRHLPVKLTLSLGGALDIFSEHTKRAPVPFQRAGLEWLYRLSTEPSRAKRALDIPRFIAAVLNESKK